MRYIHIMYMWWDPFQIIERQNTLHVKQTSKLYSFSLHILPPKPIHKHAHYLQSCAGHFSSVHVTDSCHFPSGLSQSAKWQSIKFRKFLHVASIKNVPHSVIKKTLIDPHSLIKCLEDNRQISVTKLPFVGIKTVVLNVKLVWTTDLLQFHVV